MSNEIKNLFGNIKNMESGIYAIEAGYIVAITKDRQTIPLRLDIDYIETSSHTQNNIVSINVNSNGEVEESIMSNYEDDEEYKHPLSDEQTENYIKLINISFEKMRSEFRDPIDITDNFGGRK